MSTKQPSTAGTETIQILQPDWPLRDIVTAGTTLRSGGVSPPPYASLNLGLHVGDCANHVQVNRQRLEKHLGWRQPPLYLNQQHGIQVACLDRAIKQGAAYDAAFSRQQNTTCLVMTADCLPIILAHADGDVVAAIHAGWHGLAQGVIAACFDAIQAKPDKMYVWLGPAISAKHYNVDLTRYQQLIDDDPRYKTAFAWCPQQQRYATDLYRLARLHLSAIGVDSSRIYGGKWCTYDQSELFFSYRRDGDKSGRMATFISLN